MLLCRSESWSSRQYSYLSLELIHNTSNMLDERDQYTVVKVQATFYIVKYTTIVDYLYSSYTCTFTCDMCFSAISCKFWVAIPAWKQQIYIEGLLYTRHHAQCYDTFHTEAGC